MIKNIKSTLKKKGIEIIPSPVKMDPKIKALWVANLLTETYTKTTKTLRKEDCYCVLGVLCDLYDKQNKENNWYRLKSGTYIYEDEVSIAFSSVIEWAALTHALLRKGIVRLSDNNIYCDIMSLNDFTQKACSFEDLLEKIKKRLYMEHNHAYSKLSFQRQLTGPTIIQLSANDGNVPSCDGNYGMNYCDENECIECKRILAEPTDLSEHVA